MNIKLKFALYPIVIFLVIAAVFIAVIYPRYTAMDKVRKEVNNYRNIIEFSTGTITDLSQIEERLAATRNELAVIEAKLPNVSEFSRVIEYLAKMSRDHKITVNSVNPIIFDVQGAAGANRQILKKRYIEVNIKCRFQTFGKFIEAIANLPTMFVVEDFNMEREDDIYPDLRISILLSIYMVED